MRQPRADQMLIAVGVDDAFFGHHQQLAGFVGIPSGRSNPLSHGRSCPASAGVEGPSRGSGSRTHAYGSTVKLQ